MRNVPIFQRRRQVQRRRDGAWPVALVLCVTGCIFELAEVVDAPIGGGGVGGFGGTSTELGGGGNPPGGSTNGGSGGGGDSPCGYGQTFCNEMCVALDPSNGCGDPNCQPCPTRPQTIIGCDIDTRQCKVNGCDVGFGDCDGDMINATGAIIGNGCEYSFGTIGTDSAPLLVPNLQIRLDDASRDEWTGVPAYRLRQPCVDCSEDNVLPAVVAQNEVPSESDLNAYFRVAWDQDFFYVLGEAFDNRIFDQGATLADGRCNNNDGLPGPSCEDSFSLFFDGLDNRGAFNQNDDKWVFFGTSGKFVAPAAGQPPASAVDVQVLPSTGGYCYRIEAQFDWSYLVGNAQQPIEGKFPPAEGQTYGFDVAVNDWDESVSNPELIERQSQLFYNPKPAQLNYRARAEGLGGLRLSGSMLDGVSGSLQ